MTESMSESENTVKYNAGSLACLVIIGESSSREMKVAENKCLTLAF